MRLDRWVFDYEFLVGRLLRLRECVPPCPMGVFDLRHPHVVTKGKGKGRSRCVSLRFDFRGPDPDPAVGRQHCEGERESGDDLLCRWAASACSSFRCSSLLVLVSPLLALTLSVILLLISMR